MKSSVRFRLVVFERNILFCANDIARCLGFADPWSAVEKITAAIRSSSSCFRNGTKV
jgi:prophage antirepressor-like protein